MSLKFIFDVLGIGSVLTKEEKPQFNLPSSSMIFMIGLGIYIGFLVIIRCSSIILIFISLIFPAWMNILTISDKGDPKPLLKYWMAYSTIKFIEFIFSFSQELAGVAQILQITLFLIIVVSDFNATEILYKQIFLPCDIFQNARTIPLFWQICIGGVIYILSSVFGVVSTYITLISIIYPLCMSIQAVENEDLSQGGQWLIYWTFFAIITLTDITIGFTLELIPFYHILKLTLFIALFHPQLKGVEKLYEQFVFQQKQGNPNHKRKN